MQVISLMVWNWQQPDWPNWCFDPKPLTGMEEAFLLSAGRLMGIYGHLDGKDRDEFKVSLLSDEAVKTSMIEGEILNRDSVRSSLQRQFGLKTDSRRASPAEIGIAELIIDCCRTFDAELNHEVLFDWHRKIFRGQTLTHTTVERSDQSGSAGAYRTGTEPMQIVSGPIYKRKVHFEAPPSKAVPQAMQAFLCWFGETGRAGRKPISALARAGLAHLYFVSIHPFDDGNGRIARVLAEKALSQALGQPSMLALSCQIERDRKNYYAALKDNSTQMEATDWLCWFGQTALKACDISAAMVSRLIVKTRTFDRLRGRLNPRQEKVLLRLFRAGPEGFTGGLSAGNYMAITKASPATARRDLADLAAKGALTRTGERKGTRYHLKI